MYVDHPGSYLIFFDGSVVKFGRLVEFHTEVNGYKLRFQTGL